MKRKLFIMAMALLGAFTFTQERYSIAILPFRDTGNVFTDEDSDLFYQAFCNEFVNKSAGSFTVVPRQELEILNDILMALNSDILLSFLLTEEMLEIFSSLNVTHILFCTVKEFISSEIFTDGGDGLPEKSISLIVSFLDIPKFELSASNILLHFTKEGLLDQIPNYVQNRFDSVYQLAQ
jgi:hypothetical protein